jgi:hypothetical protein
MRLRIHITHTADGHWTLSYADAVPSEPVELERVAKGAYPVMKRVGAVFDEAALAALAARLAAKQPREGEVQGFGQHLFQVLIGEALWGQLPGGPPSAIELLCTDTEFARLPWEIMHGPGGFLAEEGIAVIRIAPANSGETSVTVRPRVLFVVGAELHDPRIRAGAEYLGLLRRLENTGVRQQTGRYASLISYHCPGVSRGHRLASTLASRRLFPVEAATAGADRPVSFRDERGIEGRAFLRKFSGQVRQWRGHARTVLEGGAAMPGSPRQQHAPAADGPGRGSADRD